MSQEQKIYKPKPISGFPEWLPEYRAVELQWMDKIRRVFESYGFAPLETPIMEDLALLTAKGTGGQEIEKEVYAFEDQAQRKLGLRFDLTVPLGRVAASNPQLRKPFKRYEIGPVFRYDKPQAKRYRKFTQADADTLGTTSLLAEFECVAFALEIMQRLGLSAVVRINSRELLEKMALATGTEAGQIKDCFRCIDKADKFGWEGVEKEMKEKNLPTQILGLLRENSLERVEKALAEKKLDSLGLKQIRELLKMAEENGLSGKVKADLSLARGLEYYTGIVFEVAVAEGPSVGGGGRYDKLVELYGGQPTPAVGISFGIDRLLDTLEAQLPGPKETQVYVFAVGQELEPEALKIAQKLRGMGFRTELDLMQRSPSKNLEYAAAEKIPLAVFVGEKELKEKAVAVKDLRTGKQETLKLEKLAELKKRLE